MTPGVLFLPRKDEGTETELERVAARPDHQGKRLGYWICLAVLHRMRDLRFTKAFIWTDDHRLPALKTYFN